MPSVTSPLEVMWHSLKEGSNLVTSYGLIMKWKFQFNILFMEISAIEEFSLQFYWDSRMCISISLNVLQRFMNVAFVSSLLLFSVFFYEVHNLYYHIFWPYFSKLWRNCLPVQLTDLECYLNLCFHTILTSG